MNPFLRKKPNPISGKQKVKLDGLAAIRRRWWKFAEEQAILLLCGICGETIDKFEDLISDHIVPGKMGGCRDDSDSNLQPAHEWCNQEKGSSRKVIQKCKRRAGKIMKIKDAKAYWSGVLCFCEGQKRPAESFCPECSLKLSEQTRYTLQHADNPDDYRQALAQAEIEILQFPVRKAAGE